MRRAILGLAAGLLIVSPTAQAPGGIVLVSSRADLGANDFIGWGQLGPNGTVVLSDVGSTPVAFPSSGSIVTDDGIGVSASARARVTDPVTIPLAVSQLVGLPSIKLGDVTVSNNSTVGYSPSLDIVLSFDQPVFAVGADISAYLGQVTELDRTFYSMEAFSQTGAGIGGTGNLFTDGPFNGFIGLKTDSAVADISSIRIQAFDLRLDPPQHFEKVHLELNRLDILNGLPQNAAVPEPSSMALLGLGMTVLGGYGWRRSKMRAE